MGVVLATSWAGGVSERHAVARFRDQAAGPRNRQLRWALGLRAVGATEASVEAALERGEIVRSHPMRGTHHFVASADLRWLLELIAPRTLAMAVHRHRNLGLVALDDRIPAGATLDREAALGELARRYFTTRGPATVRDFAWWSSLTAAEARRGIEHAGTLRAETIDGIAYWRGDQRATRRIARAHLLPPFDEYTVAYQDRSAAGAAPKTVASAMESWLLSPNVVLDGKAVGVWKRTVRGDAVWIAITPWRKLTRPERAAIDEAAQAYARFAGLPAAVTLTSGS